MRRRGAVKSPDACDDRAHDGDGGPAVLWAARSTANAAATAGREVATPQPTHTAGDLPWGGFSANAHCRAAVCVCRGYIELGPPR